MSFLREDKVRVHRQLTQEAIALAMAGRWEEAATINREIIDSYPNDAEAFNRLGRSLMELGCYEEARAAYSQALELDPYNIIARKNLSRLAPLQDQGVTPLPQRHRVVPQLFMSETGKAGIVTLERPASKEVLARLAAGNEVSLRVQGQRLLVEDRSGAYIGEVKPPHSLRLIQLMAGGNSYTVAIASIKEGGVSVLIREVYQHPTQVGRLSFLPREAEAPAAVEMPSEAEEEVLSLEEGEEEPVAPSDGEQGEAGAEEGDDGENAGD